MTTIAFLLPHLLGYAICSLCSHSWDRMDQQSLALASTTSYPSASLDSMSDSTKEATLLVEGV